MKHLSIKTGIIFLLAAMVTLSCKKEDQMAIDDQLINNFITTYQDEFDGNEAQKTESGLYYVIMEPGSADHPTIQSEVTVNYLLLDINGDFIEAVDDGITFPLTNVISGWQEGIPLFGKGGEGWLLVPSHLAYGNTIRPGIPPNSVLIFYIELLDFQ